MQHPPRFGEWNSIEKLGEGGMGAVYRVVNPEGEERAVKILYETSAESIQRFNNEAKLLMELDHPNIIKVHSHCEDAEAPWITMDLMAGRDLDEERKERGPFEPERAARLIADVADGLSGVHAKGIRHRDIKPANIIIAQDGLPRLIDFGIARDIGESHMTESGMIVGTAAYLPPEVFLMDDLADAQDSSAADIYALGQTLFELLTGNRAFRGEKGQGDHLLQVMREKIGAAHLDPRHARPGTPDGLAQLVIDATKQDPKDRIQTAADLSQRLRAWIDRRESTVSAPVSHIIPSQLPAPPGHGEATPAAASGAPLRARTTMAVIGVTGLVFALGAALLGGAILVCLWLWWP